ncbi:uncharacterized protein LOC128237204 isoform X2 [Mya arenaria]|uniref:uncharacterized protein LOC128237204 isoform X2 n=1 Tax=Mya arenaria TaxID=6604 RepID=UPI0022E31650|nr:uncharacterized protein LOC128237204 isoform X2 [Mya arenaria]
MSRILVGFGYGVLFSEHIQKGQSGKEISFEDIRTIGLVDNENLVILQIVLWIINRKDLFNELAYMAKKTESTVFLEENRGKVVRRNGYSLKNLFYICTRRPMSKLSQEEGMGLIKTAKGWLGEDTVVHIKLEDKSIISISESECADSAKCPNTQNVVLSTYPDKTCKRCPFFLKYIVDLQNIQMTLSRKNLEGILNPATPMNRQLLERHIAMRQNEQVDKFHRRKILRVYSYNKCWL